MKITRENLHELFRYQEPTPKNIENYQAVRRAGYDFANAILANAPDSDDQQRALHMVRQAVMFANAAIALDGKV